MSSPSTAMKRTKRGVPEGLWIRCPGCKASIYRKEAEKLLNVCPQCEYHFYVSALDRIQHVLDDGTFEEWDGHLQPSDPLNSPTRNPTASDWCRAAATSITR
jgi:acetyl-CoA carboxylase carboxyl transferase subunit beta